jgi:hypothetical protein
MTHRREWIAWVVALAAVVGAAVLSHRWGEQSLSPVYPILFLAILSLAFKGTREWLAKATNIKLPGGVEITRAVEDAVAEAAALPDVDEDESSSSDHKLKILEPDWWEDPAAALLSLRIALDDRLTWLGSELYGSRKRSMLATIERLRGDDLIRPYEARLAKAVRDASGRFIATEIDRGGDSGEAATRFIEKADKVVYQIRLIAFDALIRKGIEKRGLRIIDIHGQPSGRWPDFFVFDPDREAGSGKALRVSVRMARTKTSDLIDGVRRRFRSKPPETPFDDERVTWVIVFPQTSKTKPPEDDEIPAFKRDRFFAWIEDWARRPEA